VNCHALIKPARETDCEKCAEIHIEARAQKSYLPDSHTHQETLAWMTDVVFRSEQVIVAELNGSIVGYASYAGKSLSNMYVLPGYQRRGVGSLLLVAVLREIPSGAQLSVFEDNIGAIQFYERYGFITVSSSSGDNAEGFPDRLMKQIV
jgi:ribosomal protein S18 acetylase RimI-like enzyme